MKDSRALKTFCGELSTDAPSPGGGTAAAASGAMAASLLVMVCGITAKNKKHAANKKKLEALRHVLERKRDDLIALAREDARAYDMVVRAIREARAERGRDSLPAVKKATMYAAKVPMRTATLCIDVLKGAVKVSELGTRSASSDVGVATLLAHTGYMGAAMNVRINLASLDTSAFARTVARRLELYDDLSDELKKDALRTLRTRAK